jgi:hypothetical protein
MSSEPKHAYTHHYTVPEVLKTAEESINTVVDDVSKLSQAASKLPYYKFNNMWSRQMQSAVCHLD